MVEVLLAGVLAMVISILSGPKFIDFLRKNEFKQQIREEGPEHVVKQGTPAMGGLLIMISMAIPFLIFLASRTSAGGDRVLRHPRLRGDRLRGRLDQGLAPPLLGLSGRWKLLWLGAITLVVAVVSTRGLDDPLTTDVYLPLLDIDLPLSWGWYVLLFVIIAGAANPR